MPNIISTTLTDGCGESKGCLRIPSGCTQPGCDFLATYQSQGEHVTFELYGRDIDWVAIGFNDAKSMVRIYFLILFYISHGLFCPAYFDQLIESRKVSGLKTVTENNNKTMDFNTPV